MGGSLESVLAHQRFKKAYPFWVAPAGGGPYAGCAERAVLPEVLPCPDHSGYLRRRSPLWRQGDNQMNSSV